MINSSSKMTVASPRGKAGMCAFIIDEKSWAGSGLLYKWQKGRGNYIAVAGQDNFVKVFDRHGGKCAEIKLSGRCVGMDWDKNGNVLALIAAESSSIFLWDRRSKGREIERRLSGDQMSIVLWSKNSSLLAVGTHSGGLLIYRCNNEHRIIIGKHTRKITCGCWNSQDLLALGSDDNTLSISNRDGDTLRKTSFRREISDICFSPTKGENIVSVVVDKKILILSNVNNLEDQQELSFQSHYGNIESYCWYGDGYILIGFSHGQFLAISTHFKGIGNEICHVHNHKHSLNSVAISPAVNRAATCGDKSIKIQELSKLNTVISEVELEDETEGLDKLSWTDDGHLLAASTHKGRLHVFFTKLPILGDSYGTKFAYLSSPMEVTVADKMKRMRHAVRVGVEPTFIALGPHHVAVGMNDRAWLYTLPDEECGFTKLREIEYLGTIASMCLNSGLAAALFDGRVQLHKLDDKDHEEKQTKLLPDDISQGGILCHALTDDFLYYSTDLGHVECVTLKDYKTVSSYRHLVGVRKVFPDLTDSCVVFIDVNNDVFLLSTVNTRNHCMEVPNTSPTIKGVLWVCSGVSHVDRETFVIYDEYKAFTYILHKINVYGQRVVFVGATALLPSQKPLLLYNGVLTCQTSYGRITKVALSTHAFLRHSAEDTRKHSKMLTQAIMLKRFHEVWYFCMSADSKKFWADFGKACLVHMEVELAICVYRKVGDKAMVRSLQAIKGIKEMNLLAAHLARLLGDYDRAQELYLSSSNPNAALEMRIDLSHWDIALVLAKTLAVDQIPFILKEYAMKLESIGVYENALAYYEEGLTHHNDEHDEACEAGIARMCIRTGDFRRGAIQAIHHPSRELKMECAALLETMEHLPLAALVYEKAQCYDKATSLYIRSNKWAMVAKLLPHVSSPAVHQQYGKALEEDGKYEEAVQAYTRAEDWPNVIRVLLEHLKRLQDAVGVVMDIQSVDLARNVARFFVEMKDYGSAIHLLLLFQCRDEAFKLAQEHRLMELYADIIGAEATQDEYRSIALYFRAEENHLQAGSFFLKCEQYSRALTHFLKCPSTDDLNITMAIRTVVRANDGTLTKQVIAYLMGKRDGRPKDPKYLYQLFVGVQDYKKAAGIAIKIARREQCAGSYAKAHEILFRACRELQAKMHRVPAEMGKSLMNLHFYLVAKIHAKRDNQMTVARMLVHVGNNISMFPCHTARILKAAVIQCYSAGLRNTAFRFATMLMMAEYYDQLSLTYRKKIEEIIRHPATSDLLEKTTPCPFCGCEVRQNELLCVACNNNLPYCIVTGCHMIKEDWSVCPHCKFPALHSQFQLFLEKATRCPMCCESLNAQQVKKMPDCSMYLGADVREQ